MPPVAAVDYSFSNLEYVFSFGFSLFLLRLRFFRLWFFELAFHLVLSAIRATIRVVALVIFSITPAIGLAHLVLVHRLHTCRVSDFCFFCQFDMASRRYLSYNKPRHCRFPPSAVFRSSLLHFRKRSQHRRDVISLTFLLALRSPWKGPLELCLCFLLPFLLHYVE